MRMVSPALRGPTENYRTTLYALAAAAAIVEDERNPPAT
jgi:hypothetical protein